MHCIAVEVKVTVTYGDWMADLSREFSVGPLDDHHACSGKSCLREFIVPTTNNDQGAAFEPSSI